MLKGPDTRGQRLDTVGFFRNLRKDDYVLIPIYILQVRLTPQALGART